MAQLALVAMLLLALLPTIGRLVHASMPMDGAQAGMTQSGSSGWAAMCSNSGLKYVAAPFSLPAPEPAPPSGHAGMDCDYCPLLASLLFVALCLALALPFPQRAFLVALRHAPRRDLFHPCGLGSRGPPIVL